MQERERLIAFLQQPANLGDLQAKQYVFRREEIRSFLSAVHDRNDALQTLTPLLTSIDSFHTGVLAQLCGILVEWGGDARISVDATVELMASQLRQVEAYLQKRKTLPEGAAYHLLPEATRAHHGLPLTLLAVMTMLSRDKQARKRWHLRGDMLKLVEKLEETYETLFYVKEALSLLDDQELIVLDPVNMRGFQIHIEGVQDRMYHCYALLQHAL